MIMMVLEAKAVVPMGPTAALSYPGSVSFLGYSAALANAIFGGLVERAQDQKPWIGSVPTQPAYALRGKCPGTEDRAKTVTQITHNMFAQVGTSSDVSR